MAQALFAKLAGTDLAYGYVRYGRAEQARRLLSAILAERNLRLSERARTRIADCADRRRLETWIRRAVGATRESEIFDTAIDNYEFRSDIALHFIATGRVEEARALVRAVLTERHLGPSPESAARIAECEDLEVLERWALRASSVRTEDDVFAVPQSPPCDEPIPGLW